MFLKKKKCPKCKCSWDGGSILETFLKQRDEGYCCWQKKVGEDLYIGMSEYEISKKIEEMYSPPYRWSRLIGIEVEGYDGVSYWQCPDCKTTWNRFNGKEEPIREKV